MSEIIIFPIFRSWRYSDGLFRTKRTHLQAGLRTLCLTLFRIPAAGDTRGGAEDDKEQDGAVAKDHGREEGQEEDEKRGCGCQSRGAVLDLVVRQVLGGQIIAEPLPCKLGHFRRRFGVRFEFCWIGSGISADSVSVVQFGKWYLQSGARTRDCLNQPANQPTGSGLMRTRIK